MDSIIAPLVQSLCKLPRDFGESRSMAIVDSSDKIVGGLVFHNWHPEAGTIEVSVGSVSSKWLTRGVLKSATRYAYDHCMCHAIVARTDAQNPTRRIWTSLGASEHVIPHLRGPGVPEYIYVLTREVWDKSKFAR